MIFSIFSPSAGAVKPRRHSRILRADITAPEIDPALRAFGRHIARSSAPGGSVTTVTGGRLNRSRRLRMLIRWHRLSRWDSRSW